MYELKISVELHISTNQIKDFKMQAWTIKQLHDALILDLESCNNQFEQTMVKAIGGKEIREKAQEWSKNRKLTPAEKAIASMYGYKG